MIMFCLEYYAVMLSVLILVLVNIGHCQDPVVTTQYGQLMGSRKIYDLRTYEEFLGIPFATPPLDALRWKKPDPPTQWEGVRNATEYSQHCTQFISPGYIFVGLGGQSGEDCLYLNIWVPGGVEEHVAAPLPVMVWIYGGAFILGTGEMYPGYALALHGDVIVVNFNYRVSTLGWLSTEDTTAPGNYGLWDIQVALTWVKENIAAFSGDPNKMTIFGQSAGGSLVSHAVISPKTNTLFQSAIAISGAATGFFGTTQQALRTAVMLSDIFHCTDVLTSQHLVDCLMMVDAHALDFWGVVASVTIEYRLPNFLPVVDGDIIPISPKECFQQGYGKHINFITGNTYHDAAGFILLNPIGLPLINNSNVAATNESLVAFLQLVLGMTSNQQELALAIVEQYPDMNTEDEYTRTLATTQAMTDWWFGSASTWEAETRYRHLDSNPTYRHVFQYRQSFLDGYPNWVNGSHLDDVYSILGEPFFEFYRRIYLREDFDETDLQISENIMNYYSNFAHTGDPNTGALQGPVTWDKFTLSQNYLQESPEFSMQIMDAERTQKYQWWMNDFPAMAEIPPDPTFPLPNDQHLTEEDIELGVERVRTLLGQQFGGNEEMWAELERVIDGFVEDRKRGIWKY